MSAVTKDIVIEALNQVEDPELMMGIVDIGLVYEVNVDEENNVAMTYSLTSMGCPAGPHIAAEIERAHSTEGRRRRPGHGRGRTGALATTVAVPEIPTLRSCSCC